DGCLRHAASLPTRRSSDLRRLRGGATMQDNTNTFAAQVHGREIITGTKTRRVPLHALGDARVGVADDRAQAFDAILQRVLKAARSEEHTSELQSRENLVCR